MFSRSFYKYTRIEITLLVKLTWVILIGLKYKAELNGFKKHFATFKVCGKGCKKTKHVSVLADAK
jgi:hypothetical protein